MSVGKTSAISGCIIWILLLGVLGSCILPVCLVIGSVTSFSDFAIQTTGKFLCPEGSTPKSYSYRSTTTDEYGNSQPTTAYELHCVDAGGDIVKEDPITYAFLWDGIFIAIGLVITMGLAFVLATPAGVFIGRLLNKNKPSN